MRVALANCEVRTDLCAEARRVAVCSERGQRLDLAEFADRVTVRGDRGGRVDLAAEVFHDTAYVGFISCDVAIAGLNRIYVWHGAWSHLGAAQFRAWDFAGGVGVGESAWLPATPARGATGPWLVNALVPGNEYGLQVRLDFTPDVAGWDEGAWRDVGFVWTQPTVPGPTEWYHVMQGD